MSRWLPVCVAAVGVLAAVAVLLHWFGGISRDLDVREAAVADREDAATDVETDNRRERMSLEVWAVALAQVDADAVRKTRELAASALLDRVLGPPPIQPVSM